jgi:glycosyltransferase involved in cell wall biosynthesis
MSARIHVFSHGVPYTGSEVTAQRVTQHLREEGYDVTFSRYADVDVPEPSEVLPADRIDLLVGTHGYFSGRLFLRGETPYILILPGSDVTPLPADTDQLEVTEQALQNAQALITYDRGFRDVVAGRWPEVQAKLWTIPKGVRVYDSHFSLKEQLALPGDAKLILLPAGLRPLKDVLYVAAEVESLHAADDRIHMAIVGIPRDPEYALDVIEYCDNSTAVHWVCALAQHQLHGAMCESAMVINTSIIDSCPNAVLEAMALGCAVVVRDTCGMSDLIRHGSTGFLFRTPSQFAAAATTILYGDVGEELGRRAAGTVARDYTLSAERLAYGNVVRSVLLSLGHVSADAIRVRQRIRTYL